MREEAEVGALPDETTDGCQDKKSKINFPE